MGNQCDQCQAVTEGCKRQQFRTQLKNREKLDLSRAQGNDKSKSKLQGLNNLRNVPLIQGSKHALYADNDGQNEQSLEIIKHRRPPQTEFEETNSKQVHQGKNKQPTNAYRKSQQQQSKINNRESMQKQRQSNIQGSEIYQDLKSIKLPIQSGIQKKNKLSLQQLEKNLLLSRQPPQLLSNNKKQNIQISNHNNSTIRIEDSIRESKPEQDDKENSTNKINPSKNAQKQSRNFKSAIQQNHEDILSSNYLKSSSPSKVLRQFNSLLKQSPIHPLTHPPKTLINSNNQNDQQPYDEQSFTQELHAVQEEAYYVKPGVYFEGFVSAVSNKLQKEGTFIFEADRTEMLVNFSNGNVNERKHAMIALSDGSAFEGLIKDQNQKGQFMVSGEGKFVFPDGSYYVGDWLKNLPHGKGKHRFPDGSSYQGEFIQGKKQGQGKFATSQGDLIYQGSFLDNRIQGSGQMQIIDPTTGKKRIYKGYFKNGKLQGQDCEAIYVDQQAKYRGSFHDGKKSGHGRYYYGDGRTWEGQWKENRQNGFGRYKNQKGVVIEGYWIDGIKSDDKLGK